MLKLFCLDICYQLVKLNFTKTVIHLAIMAFESIAHEAEVCGSLQTYSRFDDLQVSDRDSKYSEKKIEVWLQFL